jgi:signal transduction histidine kinase
MEEAAGWDGVERRRVEAVVETLARVRGGGDSVAEVAHDARNMVTALGLYCDLLEEPGVLGAPFRHYASELRLVAAASRRLVEKLVALDAQGNAHSPSNPVAQLSSLPGAVPPVASALGTGSDHSRSETRWPQSRRWDLLPALPIESLAGELMANRNLLAALAGPAISLAVHANGGALPVLLTGEDLTRVLVNLVKNAAEAMPGGGRIELSLVEPPDAGQTRSLFLHVADSGPGIAPEALDRIFDAGFSTQTAAFSETGWPATHRGLGLSIARSIIEAAGGRIRAENRAPAGARFEIQLPVRKP